MSTKEIKGFITRDDFIISRNNITSSVYELSNISLTYSKNKLQYYSSLDHLYSLYVFKLSNLTELTQTEVNSIIDVVKKFSEFLTSSSTTNKQQLIILFSNNYNSNNPSSNISNLNYNDIVSVNSIKTVDYITFTIHNINCSIWLSNEKFEIFYPEYDINIILPFNNFISIVNNTAEFIESLNNFNIVEFNTRIESNKNNIPTTYTKIINIPYKTPNTNILKDCYFGFNIYGLQGNYDHILKLKLYDMLVNEVNIDSQTVQSIFPTILNINEFFVIPSWNKIAISSGIGDIGINSQISLTYNESFVINKFIKVYNDNDFLKNNTYSVPFDYNNILLQIVNGYYTESSIRDFKSYYSDFITVTSIHPDFARMNTKTQKLITLLKNMLFIADSNNSTELFNKILQNIDYKVSIISRENITYISYFYDKHQIYVLPKYEFNSLNI